MTPLLAYGAGIGTAGLAYWQRERLRKVYQQVMDMALASHDPKAIAKVAVAFGAAGFPAQSAALQGRALSLTGSAAAGAAGTPNVLQNPSRMQAGETLQPQLSKTNQSVGRDQRGILTFQTDGNLVLYGPGQTVLWASNTGPKTGISRLTMQADGNLVIYNNSSKAVWSSGTSGNPGAYLIVQGGTAQIIGPAGQSIWNVGGPATGAGGLPGGGLGLGGRGGRGRGGYGPQGQGSYGRHGHGWQNQQGQGWQGQQAQGQDDWRRHHHHHPQPQVAAAPAPAAPAAPASDGGGVAAATVTAPTDAPDPTPSLAPPLPPASLAPDVSAASMISPTVATDSGGASDTPDPSSDGDSSDAGFGFGGFGSGSHCGFGSFG
jgi:hypothetical protein